MLNINSIEDSQAVDALIRAGLARLPLLPEGSMEKELLERALERLEDRCSGLPLLKATAA